MRKETKRRILDITDTLFSAHDDILKLLKKGIHNSAAQLLGDCQDAVISVGGIIQESEGEDHKAISLIENYCRVLFDFYNEISSDIDFEKYCREMDKDLSEIKKCIEEEIQGKIEVVFMPYKASMWDSLESVWKAADEDPDCDVFVVPIPYYDRNPDGSFGTFHYEGKEYPDYVPVTHYTRYDEKKRRPDVIYIHNPYDDCNYVTSVYPRYYSYKLKKYTNKLVYIPYFVAGYFNQPDKYSICQTPGVYNSDIVILQSEVLKNIYEMNGVNKSKILVTGSPKLDKSINSQISDFPNSWGKLKERKICLINSSITSFLEWDNFIDVIQDIINSLINIEKYSVLYRPHPLLESTIKSMRPDLAEKYYNFCKWSSKLDYFVRDEMSDSSSSVCFSDILISDYSSLIFSYIPTGKPVIQILNGVNPIRDKTLFACNTRDIYYYDYKKDKTETFIKLVIDILENDYMKEKRLNAFNTSIINSDGTCGIKTHLALKRIINI